MLNKQAPHQYNPQTKTQTHMVQNTKAMCKTTNACTTSIKTQHTPGFQRGSTICILFCYIRVLRVVQPAKKRKLLSGKRKWAAQCRLSNTPLTQALNKEKWGYQLKNKKEPTKQTLNCTACCPVKKKETVCIILLAKQPDHLHSIFHTEVKFTVGFFVNELKCNTCLFHS